MEQGGHIYLWTSTLEVEHTSRKDYHLILLLPLYVSAPSPTTLFWVYYVVVASKPRAVTSKAYENKTRNKLLDHNRSLHRLVLFQSPHPSRSGATGHTHTTAWRSSNKAKQPWHHHGHRDSRTRTITITRIYAFDVGIWLSLPSCCLLEMNHYGNSVLCQSSASVLCA